MKCRSLGKLWKSLFRPFEAGSAPSSAPNSRIDMAPLTVGFRVDRWVSTRTGQDVRSSQIIWVSPATSTRSVKALRILISPN